MADKKESFTVTDRRLVSLQIGDLRRDSVEEPSLRSPCGLRKPKQRLHRPRHPSRSSAQQAVIAPDEEQPDAPAYRRRAAGGSRCLQAIV